MPKFPGSPGAVALARLDPVVHVLSAGTRLARLYYSRSPHALRWNEFRHVGPLNSRWDHHLPTPDRSPKEQDRAICYAATDAKTCLAEFFQHTRRLDRAFQSPWLAVFETARALELLDLTGDDFTTRMGASMGIHSGNRVRARGWARDLYDAFPGVHGILYASSMNGAEPALALTDRAERFGIFPPSPLLHRALADDVLLDALKDAAHRLGYALH